MALQRWPVTCHHENYDTSANNGYKATKRSERAACDDDADDATSTPVRNKKATTGRNGRRHQTRMYTQTINSLVTAHSCIGCAGLGVSLKEERCRPTTTVRKSASSCRRWWWQTSGDNTKRREPIARRTLMLAQLALNILNVCERPCCHPHHGVTSMQQNRILRLKRLVREFFMPDEVSRMLSGKKDAVTKNKLKKQKRKVFRPLLKHLESRCVLSFIARVPEGGTCTRESSSAEPFQVYPWNNNERLVSRTKTWTGNIGRYTVSKVTWSVCMHGAVHQGQQFKLNSLRHR